MTGRLAQIEERARDYVIDEPKFKQACGMFQDAADDLARDVLALVEIAKRARAAWEEWDVPVVGASDTEFDDRMGALREALARLETNE